MDNSRVSIGLVNPKSASNVAVILRAAGCFGVSSIYYTGVRYTYAKAFNQDTKNFRQLIPTTAVDDLIDMAESGATIVAIELVEGAQPLPEYKHPENAYYIFGPEDGSISQALLERCDDVVYIPTASSLNLAVSANVVMYDRMAKSDYARGDALIRKSRDVNNNTSVK